MNQDWTKRPELRKSNGGVAILEVDVAGRVTSAQDRQGKAFASDSGTAYKIDLDRMVQMNSRTGYERDVMRNVRHLPSGAATKPKKGGDGSTEMDYSDDHGQLVDDDIPPFPEDLIDSKGVLKEPLLRACVGQLVQVQCKRDDGWACR